MAKPDWMPDGAVDAEATAFAKVAADGMPDGSAAASLAKTDKNAFMRAMTVEGCDAD